MMARVDREKSGLGGVAAGGGGDGVVAMGGGRGGGGGAQQAGGAAPLRPSPRSSPKSILKPEKPAAVSNTMHVLIHLLLHCANIDRCPASAFYLTCQFETEQVWQRSTVWAGGIPEEIANEATVAQLFQCFGDVASVTIRLKPTAKHGPCKSWCA